MSVYSGFLKTAAKKAKKKSRMSAWGKAGLAVGGVAAAGGIAALIAKHRNKPSMWTRIRRALPAAAGVAGVTGGVIGSKLWNEAPRRNTFGDLWRNPDRYPQYRHYTENLGTSSKGFMDKMLAPIRWPD